jgi:hypothetical protein
MMKKAALHLSTLLVAICVLPMASILRAQQIASILLPDAPAPPQSGSASPMPPEEKKPQANAVLKLLPSFRSVSADQHLPPQTAKQKFVIATRDSFGLPAFTVSAVVAAEQDARRATPEFGHGGVAYGRYLWHSLVDRDSGTYFVEFIVPVVTREDTRYYRLGPGKGAARRIGYALSRTVVTRSDAGNETFNASEIVGSGAAAGVSSLYYPPRDRTFENAATNWGTNVGIDAATFVVREFWPDITHALFHTGPAATAP